MDLPGFGESPPATWTATHTNLVACVEGFIDELELTDVILGGISMGGGLSLGYGLQHPDRVHGLIIASSAGITERVVDGAFSLPAQILIRLMIRTGKLDVGSRWKRQDRQQLARSLTAVLRRPGSVTDEVLDLVSREVRLGHGSKASDQYQRSETLWNRARTVYIPDLPGFAKAVLIVHGSADTGVPVAAAKRAARALPQSTLMVAEDAGHWVTRDATDRVLAAMLDFLDR